MYAAILRCARTDAPVLDADGEPLPSFRLDVKRHFHTEDDIFQACEDPITVVGPAMEPQVGMAASSGWNGDSWPYKVVRVYRGARQFDMVPVGRDGKTQAHDPKPERVRWVQERARWERACRCPVTLGVGISHRVREV